MKGSRKKMWVWNAHVQVQTWMTLWWTFYASNATLESWAVQQGHELCVHWDNCVLKCKQFCEQLNRDTQPTGETRETNRTRELYKDIRRHVLAHAGNLSFRFQHGPLIKRFRPVVTRVPAVVLSKSRFSRLAVTRAWLFALFFQHQRGRGLTVTLARVLWVCHG